MERRERGRETQEENAGLLEKDASTLAPSPTHPNSPERIYDAGGISPLSSLTEASAFSSTAARYQEKTRGEKH